LTHSQTGLSLALENKVSLLEFRLFNADVQDLHKKLPKGFWLAIPGESDDISGLVESHLAGGDPIATSFTKKSPSS
jgi:hypothetical protein